MNSFAFAPRSGSERKQSTQRFHIRCSWGSAFRGDAAEMCLTCNWKVPKHRQWEFMQRIRKKTSTTPSPCSLDLILKLFCMQTWFIALRFSALLLQLLKLRNFHKHTETETDDRESTSSERETIRAQRNLGVHKWCLNAKQTSFEL